MEMTISLHVNVKNPETNQFPYMESITSYTQLADEVIVVDGGTTDGSIKKIEAISDKIKVIEYPWPDDWTWDQLAHSTRVGYEACKGDWAIKMDLDYVLHEESVHQTRTDLENMLKMPTPPMGATFSKVQFQLVDRYFAKSRTHLGVNKKDYGHFINYGLATSGDDDFMWAIDVRGKTRGSDWRDLFYGDSIQKYEKMLKKVGPAILCYDLTFMTEKHLKKVRPFYDRARARYLYVTGEPKHDTMAVLKKQFYHRKIHKSWIPLALKGHPKIMQEQIKNMTPDMFGYNNFGWFGDEYRAVYF